MQLVEQQSNYTLIKKINIGDALLRFGFKMVSDNLSGLHIIGGHNCNVNFPSPASLLILPLMFLALNCHYDVHLFGQDLIGGHVM